jgi:DNA segregation ATPase FtsK/SpoIIIE-like protein
VVTGLIKSNLPMKVCLRVANATNSQIVIGETGAESLLGKGDLLCDLGKGITREQFGTPLRPAPRRAPLAPFRKAYGLRLAPNNQAKS